MKDADIRAYIKSAPAAELSDLRAAIDSEMAARRETKAPAAAGKAAGSKILSHTDGASRGNPGKAGIGVVLFNEKGDVILEDCQFIGECTNNEAEYRALILALERGFELTQDTMECYLDSELVVRQLIGRYAVKSEKMAGFFKEVKDRAARFKKVSFHHVRREHPRQQLADKMANRGIDEA